MSSDVGCVLLTGNGPSPEGRRLGVLLRRRPAHPRPRRLPVRRRARRAETIDPARTGRLHILEVQRLIRFMPKVVICVVPGLGGGRRAQPARGLRPDPRQPRARPVQADRRRRGQLRRRLRLGLPGPPGRAEVRPGDLLPRPRPTTPRRRTGWARSTRSCRTPTWRPTALEWAAKINGKSPTAQRMLKYAFNLRRRRPGRPAGVRRRGHPAGLHDRRGRRGPGRVPGEARPDWTPFPWYF